MGSHTLQNAGLPGCQRHGPLKGPGAEMPVPADCSGEEPVRRLLEALVCLKLLGGDPGQHDHAVLLPLPAPHMDDPPFLIHILDPQTEGFPDTKAGGIEEDDQGSVFGVLHRFGKAPNLVPAQNGGEGPLPLRSGNPGHGPRAVQDRLMDQLQGADGLAHVAVAPAPVQDGHQPRLALICGAEGIGSAPIPVESLQVPPVEFPGLGAVVPDAHLLVGLVQEIREPGWVFVFHALPSP